MTEWCEGKCFKEYGERVQGKMDIVGFCFFLKQKAPSTYLAVPYSY